MGCSTSTLVEMIVALLEAPGNMTWSQPATWAGAAIGMSKQAPVTKPSSFVHALKSLFSEQEESRPQMFVRAQSSGPEVDIDAPAVRATSFSDQLPTSAPAWTPWPQPEETSEIKPVSPVGCPAGRQGSGVCRPTEQISRSLFADTPVGGIVARVPQETTPPDTQATAPALLSHETSSVTSDVASPPSPVLLIRQPEELGTVSITPALISRPRSRCQKTLQIAGNISPGPLSSACRRRINPSSLRLSPMRLTQSTPASPRGPDAAVCDKLDLPPFFWEYEDLDALLGPLPSLPSSEDEDMPCDIPEPKQAALEYDPCSSSPFNSFASAVDCPDRLALAVESASLIEVASVHIAAALTKPALPAACIIRPAEKDLPFSAALTVGPCAPVGAFYEDLDLSWEYQDLEATDGGLDPDALLRTPPGLALHFADDERTPCDSPNPEQFQDLKATPEAQDLGATLRPPPGLPLPSSDEDEACDDSRPEQCEDQHPPLRPPPGLPWPSSDDEDVPCNILEPEQCEDQHPPLRPPPGLPWPSSDDEDVPCNILEPEQCEDQHAPLRPPPGLPWPFSDNEDVTCNILEPEQCEDQHAPLRPPPGLPWPSSDDEDAPCNILEPEQCEDQHAPLRPPPGLPWPSSDDEDVPCNILEPEQYEDQQALVRPPPGLPLPSSDDEDEAYDKFCSLYWAASEDDASNSSASAGDRGKPALPAACRPRIPPFAAAQTVSPQAPVGAATAAPVLPDSSDEIEIDRSLEVPLFDDGNGGTLCYDELADFS